MENFFIKIYLVLKLFVLHSLAIHISCVFVLWTYLVT